MKRLTLLSLGLLSLAACSGNTPIGLSAFNLRTLENTCTPLEGKKYLALAFNYTGKLDTLKFSFTPYSSSATPVVQTVKIGDVTAPPSSYAKVLLNESTVAKVYLSLPDAVLSSAGVTPPDTNAEPAHVHPARGEQRGRSVGRGARTQGYGCERLLLAVLPGLAG